MHGSFGLYVGFGCLFLGLVLAYVYAFAVNAYAGSPKLFLGIVCNAKGSVGIVLLCAAYVLCVFGVCSFAEVCYAVV